MHGSFHAGTVMTPNPVFLIVARLFITHGKDIYLQSLNNSSKSRLALRLENPIFTKFCTTTFVHRCRVAGNTLIQRTHINVTNLLGEKCNNKNIGLSCISLPKTRRVLVPYSNTIRTIKIFRSPI